MEQYLTWDIEEFTQKLNEQLAPLGLRVTEEDVKLCFYNRKTLDWRDLRKIYGKLYNEKLTSDRKEAECIERERAKEERRETRKQERKIETSQWKEAHPKAQPIYRSRSYYRRRLREGKISQEQFEKKFPPLSNKEFNAIRSIEAEALRKLHPLSRREIASMKLRHPSRRRKLREAT